MAQDAAGREQCANISSLMLVFYLLDVDYQVYASNANQTPAVQR